MRKVLGLVVCLALTGSIASANMPAFSIDTSNMSNGAAKMETPSFTVVPVVAGRGGELSYRVDFTHNNGTVSAMVDVGDKDYRTVKRLGGHIEVRLYTGNNRGQMKKIRSLVTHGDKAIVTFPSHEVCNHVGSYTRFVKVWASARMLNGSPMPGYTSDPAGKYMSVNCFKSGWTGFTIVD